MFSWTEKTARREAGRSNRKRCWMERKGYLLGVGLVVAPFFAVAGFCGGLGVSVD